MPRLWHKAAYDSSHVFSLFSAWCSESSCVVSSLLQAHETALPENSPYRYSSILHRVKAASSFTSHEYDARSLYRSWGSSTWPVPWLPGGYRRSCLLIRLIAQLAAMTRATCGNPAAPRKLVQTTAHPGKPHSCQAK